MGTLGGLLGADLFDPAELRARGEIRNVEREVVAKSGERRVVLIHLKRVSIQGGTVLCTCRDVTELKEAERQLAATRLELAHAARLAIVGEMTASIVHEIQQPLTAIQANASAGLHVARKGSCAPEAAEELGEIFTDIHAASGDATAIVQRLKTLSRKRPLELAPIDMNRVASDVLLLVAADASRRHVTIHAELSRSLPPVQADRVSLQHVLLNLVVNAMEAIDDDGQAGQVVVSTRPAMGAVECAVSDTGRGIAAAELPRIFDPFYSTKKDGVGLGLAIARTIVEAHSGRIWADDEGGRGATFRVTLPVPPRA
jgi:signal transduction histidine kinase